MDNEKVDYGSTLNLPKTDFAMKANLPQREPVILEKWEKEDLYNKALEKNKGNKSFILHDGPPYANGDIHLGHTLNKVIKDIINRYKTMQGFYSPYVPGWDTHGLPIELQAIKKLGIKKNEMSAVEFRRQCRDYALTQVERQKGQFKRLGVVGDFENPYLTLRPEFEAKQIEIFGAMAEKGYIYKGLKPVYWCSSCETALAEAEVEYADKTSSSIYVRFNVKDDKGVFKNLGVDPSKVYYIIWTTTPWTLPANLGIALGPEFEYVLVKEKEEYYVVAKALLDSVKEAVGFEECEVVAEFKGLDLEKQVCSHPFIDRDSLVIVGDHVTLESGTGCVHTAPGHGKEDFEVGQKYGLGVLNPVDNRGRFTSEAGKYEGLKYSEGNEAILEDIRESGALLTDSKMSHSYPHCWRCKKPIIFRATEQWFASIDGFKDAALKEIKNVNWIPEWGEERITSMVSDRADWCISRQRVWGVPIPIFYCEKCNKEIINKDTIAKVSSIFKEKGSDAWFEMEAKDLVPENTICECGCNEFRKEMDIMDVWFDSGSSHAGVLDARDELNSPADIYLEGNDQYRGWFQSSLLTSVAAKGEAPYKTVITHGMVVDGDGKKMSKSLGNGIDPMDVIKENGADILRLWVSSADYKSDVRISKNILKQLSEGYRKIRNTARYMIGNLSDFDPATDKVSYEDMNELDKWAYLKLQKLISGVTASYESYQFHAVYHDIHNFCVVDMSNFYLDIIKDRLYTEKSDSNERRAAQTVMHETLNALVKMVSPIMAFTSEEIWNFVKHENGECATSVLLANWPKAVEIKDDELETKWDKMLEIRAEVSKALELARKDKTIGNSLNAKVYISAEGEVYDFLQGMNEYLETVFIVSQLELSQGLGGIDERYYKSEEIKGLSVLVEQAPGEKCERCWIFSSTIGEDENHPTLCSRCSSVVEKL